MRRALTAAIAVLALVALPIEPASAGDPVKEREAAQARANAAAAKFAKATTSLARVERELKDLEARTASTRTRLDGLEGEVRTVAVNSYIRGNVGEAFVFDRDLSKTSRRNAMARYVTVGDTEALDEFRAAREDLEEGSAAVRRQLEDRKDAAAALRKQKTAAYAELSKLAAAEQAYLAKIAAEKEAAAKRAAEAQAAASRAAKARATASSGATVPLQGDGVVGSDRAAGAPCRRRRGGREPDDRQTRRVQAGRRHRIRRVGVPRAGTAIVLQRLGSATFRRAAARGQRHPLPAGHAHRRTGGRHRASPQLQPRWPVLLPLG